MFGHKRVVVSKKCSLATSTFVVFLCISWQCFGCLGFSVGAQQQQQQQQQQHQQPKHNSQNNSNNKIPVTILSGFLGSGKTTLIQHLLNNNQGLKIALIVNDVASVNIDSKLIAATTTTTASSSSSSSGMTTTTNPGRQVALVELQNGCACCSRSEEFLASLAELVTLNDLRGDDAAFDHIVVELSGVADPRAIRAQWQEAQLFHMPLTERLQLDTFCTMVDCHTFLDLILPNNTSPQRQQQSLLLPKDENTIIPFLWQDLVENKESLPALLAAQIETADVVLLNKIDLVLEEHDNKERKQIPMIRDIVQALVGHRATILETSYAQVGILDILAKAKGSGVVLAGLVDDHHDAIQAAVATKTNRQPLVDTVATTHSHDSNQHRHHENKDSTSSSHNSDTSHESSGGDQHPEEHSHNHGHDHSHLCTDPQCTDPSHQLPAKPRHAGIGTFVYQARRPFHPERLQFFLSSFLGISHGILQSTSSSTLHFDGTTRETLPNILRSKGFTWMANSDKLATYWSQVGKSFELGILGSWWATLSQDQWPPELVETILQDFVDDPMEGGGSQVGDRRQEVVFIGFGVDDPRRQELIRSVLNQCLLSDNEWKTYQSLRTSEQALQTTFPSSLLTRTFKY